MSAVTALAKIEAAEKSGALVFVDREWLEEKTPLYKPEITEVEINKENDCFNISGKFMPKREVVDRISEANGIDFTFGEVKTMTIEDDMCGKRIVYTAKAQGRRRMSDGSWRMSSINDYDFDPVLRGMLDYDVTELNSETKQKRRTTRDGKAYGSSLARYILDLQKVAAQRASTGARLRVARELAGMPIAFTEQEISKPLYFGRIVQNTEYILKTPEGRKLATAVALGVDVTTLFGKPSLPSATVTGEEPLCSPAEPTEPEPTPEPGNNTADLAAQAAADDVDFPAEGNEAQETEQEEFERLTVELEQYLTYKDVLDVKTKSGVNPYQLAQSEFNSKTATVLSRGAMVKRVRDFLVMKKVPGVA